MHVVSLHANATRVVPVTRMSAAGPLNVLVLHRNTSMVTDSFSCNTSSGGLCPRLGWMGIEPLTWVCASARAASSTLHTAINGSTRLKDRRIEIPVRVDVDISSLLQGIVMVTGGTFPKTKNHTGTRSLFLTLREPSQSVGRWIFVPPFGGQGLTCDHPPWPSKPQESERANTFCRMPHFSGAV